MALNSRGLRGVLDALGLPPDGAKIDLIVDATGRTTPGVFESGQGPGAVARVGGTLRPVVYLPDGAQVGRPNCPGPGWALADGSSLLACRSPRSAEGEQILAESQAQSRAAAAARPATPRPITRPTPVLRAADLAAETATKALQAQAAAITPAITATMIVGGMLVVGAALLAIWWR